MSKYEQIKERYGKGYITDEQLWKYFQMNVLTEEQYWEIYYTKHEQPIPPNEEEILEEEVVEEDK